MSPDLQGMVIAQGTRNWSSFAQWSAMMACLELVGRDNVPAFKTRPC